METFLTPSRSMTQNFIRSLFQELATGEADATSAVIFEYILRAVESVDELLEESFTDALGRSFCNVPRDHAEIDGL